MKSKTTRDRLGGAVADDTQSTEVSVASLSLEQKLDRDCGARAGKEWAVQDAEPRELECLAKWKAEIEAEPVCDFGWFCQNDEHPPRTLVEIVFEGNGDSREFWKNRGWQVGRAYPTRAFVRGFVEGALAAANSSRSINPDSGSSPEQTHGPACEVSIANYNRVANDPYLLAELRAWERFASVVWDRIASKDPEDGPSRLVYLEGRTDVADEMLVYWKMNINGLAMKATGTDPIPEFEDPYDEYLAELATAPSSYDTIAKNPSLIAELEAWTKFAAGALAQSTQNVFVNPMSLPGMVSTSADRMVERRRSAIRKIAEAPRQTTA